MNNHQRSFFSTSIANGIYLLACVLLAISIHSAMYTRGTLFLDMILTTQAVIFVIVL